MGRTSKDDKKKWVKWQGKRDKDFVKTLLNIMLQKEIGDFHEKSYRKDELYIINSDRFKEAVANARKSLGLIKGKRKGVYTADFEQAKKEALKLAGLSDEWSEYIGDFISSNKPPEEKGIFIHPRKIMVEAINEDDELLIRLKPGVRYEDYRKAWKVFSRPLGEGTRLNKSYSNESEHLKWLADKDNGMTYLQVAATHFPNNPEDNVEKIKKAIIRLKKRQKRDI